MTAILQPAGIHLETFRMIRQYGEIEQVEATYHVTQSENATNFEPDLARLATGVPRIGDQFDPKGTLDPLYFNLRCEDQEIISYGRQPDDNHLIEIKCTFRNQPIVPRVVGGASGLQQVETQKLRDGSQILVAYNGRQQGGTLQVFQPTTGFEVEVIEFTNDPEELASSWINYVNSTTFAGSGPRTWKVVDVDWTPAIRGVLTTKRWRFVYRFEQNLEKHDPTAAYVDPETNEFPPDLVDGVGVITFQYDDARDLNQLFNTRSYLT